MTSVPRDAGLELLGRLPEPETLLLLGRRGQVFPTFADLHGVSIGIGPEGSGTAYLMHQLFENPDLRGLDVRMSNHDVQEQAQLVAQGKLDIAAIISCRFMESTGGKICLLPKGQKLPTFGQLYRKASGVDQA
jgi:hypothetical protein